MQFSNREPLYDHIQKGYDDLPTFGYHYSMFCSVQSGKDKTENNNFACLSINRRGDNALNPSMKLLTDRLKLKILPE